MVVAVFIITIDLMISCEFGPVEKPIQINFLILVVLSWISGSSMLSILGLNLFYIKSEFYAWRVFKRQLFVNCTLEQ